MAEILAPTTAAANSPDQVIAAGSSLTLTLKPATGAAPLPQFTWASVLKKTSGGDYLSFGTLSAGEPVLVLSAAGTFRVSKPASSIAFGVEAD